MFKQLRALFCSDHPHDRHHLTAVIAAIAKRPYFRLRSAGGFTMSEVLLATALVSLLTLAVAAGIGAAVKANNEIRQYNDAQAVLNNAVTAVTDELRFAYDVEEVVVDGVYYPLSNIDGAPTTSTAFAFNSSIRGYRLYLGNAAIAASGAGTSTTPDSPTIVLNAVSAEPVRTSGSGASGSGASDATIYQPLQAGTTQSTPLPLANTAAASQNGSAQGFTARLTYLSWDASAHTWMFSLEVTNGSFTVTTGSELLSVRTINTW